MCYGLAAGIQFPAGTKKIIFSTASRPTLGLNQPPRALSPGIKRAGYEADHSSPSTVEVKNDGAIPPLPHMSSGHSA
jgi:hypothetical protein